MNFCLCRRIFKRLQHLPKVISKEALATTRCTRLVPNSMYDTPAIPVIDGIPMAMQVACELGGRHDDLKWSRRCWNACAHDKFYSSAEIPKEQAEKNLLTTQATCPAERSSLIFHRHKERWTIWIERTPQGMSSERSVVLYTLQ